MKKLFIIAIILSVGCSKKHSPVSNNNTKQHSTISTVAGLGGPPGYDIGLTVDGAGNIYIADSYHNKISRINSAGIMSTIAGNGTQGYSGDGGLATSCELYQPTGVAADANGNIFIADYGNNRIRVVNASGIISTFAGNGIQGYGGDGGAAISCELYSPRCVAVDNLDNVYIGDTKNNRVRVVNTSGIVNSFAGNGLSGVGGNGGAATAAQITQPLGIAVDKAGNVYISDPTGMVVRVVNTSGIINTFAGNRAGGYIGDSVAATSTELNAPKGIAVDKNGNVYIADTYNNRIRKVNTSGIITTIAGNGIGNTSGDGGPATAAEISNPDGVAVDDSGNIYISTVGDGRIRKISY